ncbi:ribonuclease H-like domain-containing protein, partial [Tanacetum coccineum]
LSGVASCDGCARQALENKLFSVSLLICLGKHDCVERIPSGDENSIHTLRDYSKPSHEGYRNTIELPAGNNVVPLRSYTIWLAQNGCSFHRLRSEDPNQHLKDFLKLMDSLDLDGSISTWKDLTTRFLAQFFPPGRTVKLRNDILMFQQHHGESLSEAWTRFKDILLKVPHQSIDLWLQLLQDNAAEGLNTASSNNLENTQNNSFAKLPLLKQGEYDTWRLRIESYIQLQDYALWEIIKEGNSFKPVARTTKNEDGTSTTTIPGAVTDAKSLFEAIEARFGGNEATKKTQKTLLKQMYETFNASSSESLDSIFNRLQKIVSQLTILGEIITPEELNLKFLRSLPTEWGHSSTNDVNTANVHVSNGSTPVSTASTNNSTACLSDATVYAYLATQPNGSQVVHEDLEQIHEDDLDEMDLKWQLALLSMKARKFYQRTGKKIIINGSDTAGYDKKKVECFNCHKLGHFARECRNPRSQENRNRSQDSSRRTVNVEESSSKAMLAIDGTGFDWSYMADEEASTNFALMAFSDSEVQNNKTCSKTCLKNFEDLKSKYDKLRIELNKSESDLDSYKKGLASVEEQLVFYKKNESMLCDQIAVLKRDASFNESDINALKKQCLGYNVVLPPLTGLFSPPSIDLSNSGLEKFKQPEFEGYGVKVNKGASENVSKEVKKTLDAPIIEDWVSDCDEDETVVLESLNVQKPKQADQPRKVSQNPRNNSTSWNTPMPKKLGEFWLVLYYISREVVGGGARGGGGGELGPRGLGGRVERVEWGGGCGRGSVEGFMGVGWGGWGLLPFAPELRIGLMGWFRVRAGGACTVAVVDRLALSYSLRWYLVGRVRAGVWGTRGGVARCFHGSLWVIPAGEGGVLEGLGRVVLSVMYLEDVSACRLWLLLFWLSGDGVVYGGAGRVAGGRGGGFIVLTKSGLVPFSTARQSFSRTTTPVSAARSFKTAAPKPSVNVGKQKTNAFQKSHSPLRRPFYQQTALKNRNLNNKVNIVKANSVNTAKGKRMTSDVGEQGINDVKPTTYWAWRPKIKMIKISLAIPGQTETGKELSNPFMLVILEKMINLKIEAEEDSNMAIELIKFIKSQIERHRVERIEQDDLTDFVPPTPHDSPLLGGHTPGSDEDCSRFGDQKAKKEGQKIGKEVKGKNSRDELFKIGTSRRKSLDKENVSKQGRKSDKTKPMFDDSNFAELDVDNAMENVEGDVETQGRNTVEQTTTAGDTVNTASIDVSTAGPSNVSTADPSTSTTGDIFDDEMMTIADTPVAIRSTRPRTASVVICNVEEEPRRATPVPTVQSQDKGKGKMVEPEPTPKNPIKAYIQRDAEIAQRLFEGEQAQFEREQRIARERAAKQKAKDAALIEHMEDVQARIDTDVLLAEILQQEERKQFTIKEKSRMLMEMIVERKRFFAGQRAKQIRNKPPTKAQLRNKMVTYLKHMGKYTHNQMKSKSFEEIQRLYEREQKWINDFVHMDSKVVKDSRKVGFEPAVLTGLTAILILAPAVLTLAPPAILIFPDLVNTAYGTNLLLG